MSRRHKEIPTITTQEIHQLAEETAGKAVDRAVRNASKKISFSGLDSFAEYSVQVIIKRALTRELENGLQQRLATILDITDTPGLMVGCTVGRTAVATLFHRFKDSDVINIFKQIYREMYHNANAKAKIMVDWLVCYLLAMCQYTDTEHVGLVAHYYRLLVEHFGESALPSLRTLQGKFKWFTEFKRKAGTAIKAVRENKLYDKWQKLKQAIFGNVQTLAPAYALY